MSKPLDPALLRAVGAARTAVLTTAVLVIAQTATVVAAALLLARALGALVGGASLAQVAPDIGWFAGMLAARAALVSVTAWRGHRGATRVIAELRDRVLAHMVALGPRWLAAHRTDATTVATRGLDALEPYLVSYLPQLLQTALLTPAVLLVIAMNDLLAAATLAFALPLIPLFMWLIGLATQRATQRRLHAQQRLDARVLDLVAGLTTLRAFGRARGTIARVRDLADAERRGTMSTLRIAFLSGAVLELLATLAVAMVAVGVGLRLVTGDLSLVTGLAVLILAPEALTPLRLVGTHFHASADGVAAVDRCLRILAEPLPSRGTTVIGDVDELTWRGVSVHPADRTRATPSNLSGTVYRGQVTILSGPSGSGKTTAVHALLGLVAPDSGSVQLRSGDAWYDLAQVDPGWRDQVTWVPQRPVIEPGTLREAAAGDAAISDASLDAAAVRSGFDRVLTQLPQRWDTVVGGHAHGLSAGQRQRLALTRALVRPARFVILDEPTAHLDSARSADIARLVRDLADGGAGVLVLTHDADLLALADQRLELADDLADDVAAEAVR